VEQARLLALPRSWRLARQGRNHKAPEVPSRGAFSLNEARAVRRTWSCLTVAPRGSYRLVPKRSAMRGRCECLRARIWRELASAIATGPATYHADAQQTNYIVFGNQVTHMEERVSRSRGERFSPTAVQAGSAEGAVGYRRVDEGIGGNRVLNDSACYEQRPHPLQPGHAVADRSHDVIRHEDQRHRLQPRIEHLLRAQHLTHRRGSSDAGCPVLVAGSRGQAGGGQQLHQDQRRLRRRGRLCEGRPDALDPVCTTVPCQARRHAGASPRSRTRVRAA
jgi:hypothetical protein